MKQKNQQPNGQPTVGAYTYQRAKKNGFEHCNAKQSHQEKIANRASMISAMDEPPTPFRTALSTACIIIGAGLGAIEVSNIQNSIVGGGGFGTGAAIGIGACLGGLGMVTGEFLSSGLKKDTYTGKYKVTGRWLVGLFLAVVFIFFQYYLAKQASTGVPEELRSTLDTRTAFIVVISILELLFGALFLKNALQMSALFLVNMRIKLFKRKMYRTAKACDENWNRHLFEVKEYNKTNNTVHAPGGETEAIKEARAYYNSGGKK